MASASSSPAASDNPQALKLAHCDGFLHGRKNDLVSDTDTIVDEHRESRVSEVKAPPSIGSALSTTSMPIPAPRAHVCGNATVVSHSNFGRDSPGYPLSDHASPTSSVPDTALNSPIPSSALRDPDIGVHSFTTLRWRLASGYFACFLIGWADGVTGTVMPYLDAEFHLTTMTSSLLWAGTTCGFFVGTLLIEIILKSLGRFSLKPLKRSIMPHMFIDFHKTATTFGHSPTQARHLALLIASAMHACYFIMMGSRGGFPLMLVAYAMAAFARALLTALLNAYFAAGPKNALGFAYGIASFGSVASPLVCQATIATGVPWFHFYYGSLVLSGINILLLALTFKPGLSELAKEHHNALSEVREKVVAVGVPQNGALDHTTTSTFIVCRPSAILRRTFNKSQPCALKQALRIPYQWILSLFALLYCGSETTTQGFMVTYLLSTKHANPKTVGYVTSGFWAGISVGRFAWGYCNEFLTFTQRKYTIHACISSFSISAVRPVDQLLANAIVDLFDRTVLGLVLQLLVWVVKSHVQNSIATGFIGAFYGPVFPAALAMANDVLPEEVHMISMALINAFASLGGAVFPIITGTVLSFEGVSAFTSVTVPLAGSLALLWGVFPSRVPVKNSVV